MEPVRRSRARVLSPTAAIRLSGYPFVDDAGDAALHRPGSWEWQTEEAVRARETLHSKGYHEVVEPTAWWRVRWVRV